MRLIALCLATCTACHALPPTHVYSGGKRGYENDGYWSETADDVGRPGLPENEGRDFCRDVENRARLRAIDQDAWGWVFGVASALAIGAGTVLTASSPDDASTGRKVANASAPVFGAALGYISVGTFSRGKDASTLAATASRSMNLSDKLAADACNNAIGDWNNARSDASKAILDAIEKAAKDKSDDAGATPASGAESAAPAEGQPPAPPAADK